MIHFTGLGEAKEWSGGLCSPKSAFLSKFHETFFLKHLFIQFSHCTCTYWLRFYNKVMQKVFNF